MSQLQQPSTCQATTTSDNIQPCHSCNNHPRVRQQRQATTYNHDTVATTIRASGNNDKRQHSTMSQLQQPSACQATTTIDNIQPCHSCNNHPRASQKRQATTFNHVTVATTIHVSGNNDKRQHSTMSQLQQPSACQATTTIDNIQPCHSCNNHPRASQKRQATTFNHVTVATTIHVSGNNDKRQHSTMSQLQQPSACQATTTSDNIQPCHSCNNHPRASQKRQATTFNHVTVATTIRVLGNNDKRQHSTMSQLQQPSACQATTTSDNKNKQYHK
ncbi:uncharacterized protein LOC128999346 [Macrosteles quadrilineatus]|uniref:uncharacterized protein LOC128999346 n=1 Tax=Macrosteles quadrilineatus TaxID=74068 RepID=UPI0023E09895|nr:uncharacterized protein LOC128999346 [Macrosteles quadrilineatus]